MLVGTRLFVNLLRRTPDHDDVTVRENFLTEAIAGLLAEDRVFARDFTALLFSGGSRRRPRSRLVGIATQRSHYGSATEPRSQIDLQLEFANFTVAVEVKIGAPEGKTSNGRRQLESHCRLKTVDAVTMISGYLQGGDFGSLGTKYLVPANGRGYFLWADVYPLLLAGAKRRGAPALHRAALGLFEYLNFEPHHKSVGDLNDPDAEARHANRARFRAYWAETYSMLDSLGANPSPPRSSCEMLTYNLDRRAWKIWLDPRHVPGSLRVWFNLHRKSDVPRVISDLRRAAKSTRVIVFAPKESTWPAVDLRIPFQVLFPRKAAEGSRGQRIARVLRPLIEAAG
jgi:hypothetical protein